MSNDFGVKHDDDDHDDDDALGVLLCVVTRLFVWFPLRPPSADSNSRLNIEGHFFLSCCFDSVV